MSWIAIILVLVSALLHASWNLLGKKVNPSVAFFSVSFSAGVLPLTPFVLPWLWGEEGLLSALFPYLVLTGVFQMLYAVGLALSYANGAISIAYPLARAIPVMLVAFFSALLGMGQLNGIEAYIGVLLVISGAFLLPMYHFRDFQIGNYLNRSTAFALLAALATAGYSLTDKLALDLMSSELNYSSFVIALCYIWLQGVSATLFLLFVQSFRAVDRARFISVISNQKKTALITGLMISMTYFLVLVAMQFTDNVSYVVALRQVSIPIGAMLGVIVLKESLGLTKALALIMLSVGVVLILV